LARRLILQEEGLNNFDDAPSKILQYASMKFSRENSSGFSDKMKKLELKHQSSVEQVFKNPDIEEDAIIKNFESPVNPFEPEKVVEEFHMEADS
jgi:hypothetical protein